MPVSWWLRVATTDPIPSVLRDLGDRGRVTLLVFPGPTATIIGVYFPEEWDVLTINTRELCDRSGNPRYVTTQGGLPEFTSRVTRLLQGRWLPQFPEEERHRRLSLDLNLPATDLNRSVLQGLRPGLSMGTQVLSTTTSRAGVNAEALANAIHDEAHRAQNPEAFRQEFLGTWAPPRQVLLTAYIDLLHIQTVTDLEHVYAETIDKLLRDMQAQGARIASLNWRESEHNPYNVYIEAVGGTQSSSGAQFFLRLTAISRQIEQVWSSIHQREKPVELKPTRATRWDVILQDDLLA